MLTLGILVLLVVTSPLVWAQTGIDAMLAQQDRTVLGYFESHFTRDHRDDKVFNRIFRRLEPHLGEVYAHPEKQVTPYVFVSNLGFNAMTWDHIIIFDSLLLDTFHRLAEGVTLYGSTDNPYVWNLARSVASLSLEANRLPSIADMRHPDNIYHLPVAGQLSATEQASSDALFEEMLASWLGHEGSHAFLDHARERLQAEEMRQWYASNGQMDSNVLGQYIQHASSADNGRDKEREADEKGAMLITRSGYSIRGFVVSLEFAKDLEDMTGMSNSPFTRSHPAAADRILDIERTTGLGGFSK